MNRRIVCWAFACALAALVACSGVKTTVLKEVVADDALGTDTVAVDAMGELCTPHCEGRECGNDGCGRACGECGEGEGCSDGECGECTASICISPCDKYEDRGYCFDKTTPCSVNKDCPNPNPLCGEAETGCCDQKTGFCLEWEICTCASDYDCPEFAWCYTNHTACGLCMEIPPLCSEDSPCAVGSYCTDGGYCQEYCCGECAGCTEGQVCFEEECCTPDCDGKECGDDGCLGSCGDCPTCPSLVCYDGQCKPDCDPQCEGKECGDDGCGCLCGVCPSGYCNAEGLCVDCEPDCEGTECGDDGCGGSCTPPPVECDETLSPEECELIGGQVWPMTQMCGCPTTDAGCECTDSGQCQGVCGSDYGEVNPAYDCQGLWQGCSEYVLFMQGWGTGCFCEWLEGEPHMNCVDY